MLARYVAPDHIRLVAKGNQFLDIIRSPHPQLQRQQHHRYQMFVDIGLRMRFLAFLP